MRKFFFIVLAMALAGCTTVKTAGLVFPETVDTFRAFPSGVVTVRGVGEQMVGYNLFTRAGYYPGYEVTEDFQPPPFAKGQNLPLIKAGSEYVAIARLEGGGYLCMNADKKEKVRATVASPFDGRTQQSTWEACLLVNASSEPYGTAVCDVWNPTASIWREKPVNFLKPKKIMRGLGVAWREAQIVYAGRNGNTIKVLYVELSPSSPFFQMEFTYDLSQSNIIAVKDLTFEVLEATNTSITFVIRTTAEELKTKLDEREKLERERHNI